MKNGLKFMPPRVVERQGCRNAEIIPPFFQFTLHYGPRVESASNRNEFEEYFLGVKAAGA
jgi:hypothetical protein